MGRSPRLNVVKGLVDGLYRLPCLSCYLLWYHLAHAPVSRRPYELDAINKAWHFDRTSYSHGIGFAAQVISAVMVRVSTKLKSGKVA